MTVTSGSRHRHGGAPSRASDLPWWISAFAAGLVLALVALGGFVIDEARRRAWTVAEASSDRMLRVLEREIGCNIARIDLSLRGVIDALLEPGIDRVDARVRQRTLFDRAATAEDLGALLVVDAKGDIVEDSTSLVPHRINLADRGSFIAHREHPDTGLFIGRPYLSRLVPGDVRLSISRRRPSRDGSFAGIVSGQLRLAYFHHLWQTLDIRPKGEIRLLRSDGAILARHAFQGLDADADLGATEAFQPVPEGAAGSTVDGSAADGTQRLVTFRHVGALPLVLTMSVEATDVLSDWWREAAMTGGAILVLCIAVLTLLALFRREMKRRAAAELALADAADELQRLARTDALTGLPNRRAFDAELNREWRRAIRAGEPISLLMLDADRFKAFNDRHGHQCGDEVLQSISACLQRAARRPGDLPARYGGEEFAMVLQGTDEAGALRMAESIRQSVEALAILHRDSPCGRVTVSVGTATLSPLVGWDPAVLLRLADAALYEAKRQGRNRVAGAEEQTPDTLRPSRTRPWQPEDATLE